MDLTKSSAATGYPCSGTETGRAEDWEGSMTCFAPSPCRLWALGVKGFTSNLRNRADEISRSNRRVASRLLAIDTVDTVKGTEWQGRRRAI